MRQLDSEPFTEGFNGRILPDYLSGPGSNAHLSRSRQVSTADSKSVTARIRVRIGHGKFRRRCFDIRRGAGSRSSARGRAHRTPSQRLKTTIKLGKPSLGSQRLTIRGVADLRPEPRRRAEALRAHGVDGTSHPTDIRQR